MQSGLRMFYSEWNFIKISIALNTLILIWYNISLVLLQEESISIIDIEYLEFLYVSIFPIVYFGIELIKYR